MPEIFPVSEEEWRKILGGIEQMANEACDAWIDAPDDRAEIQTDAELTAYENVLSFLESWEHKQGEEDEIPL